MPILPFAKGGRMPILPFAKEGRMPILPMAKRDEYYPSHDKGERLVYPHLTKGGKGGFSVLNDSPDPSRVP